MIKHPGDGAAPASFSEALAAAIRNSGIGQVAPGEVPTARSLLGAIGGIRGLVESILPGLAFLVAYTITGSLLLSVLLPVVLSLAFVAVRLLSRSSVSQAFAGIVGIAVSAVLAIISGRAVDNFLPGIVINALSLALILMSLAIRWPVIGLIVGFLTNEGTAWREQRGKRRVLSLATWLWAGLFSLRLAVELPLFLTGRTELLAGAKLLLGVPLYAGMLWVTWLLVHAVYRHPPTDSSDAADSSRPPG